MPGDQGNKKHSRPMYLFNKTKNRCQHVTTTGRYKGKQCPKHTNYGKKFCDMHSAKLNPLAEDWIRKEIERLNQLNQLNQSAVSNS